MWERQWKLNDQDQTEQFLQTINVRNIYAISIKTLNNIFSLIIVFQININTSRS